MELRGYNKTIDCILQTSQMGTLSNSEDPDDMLQNVIFH